LPELKEFGCARFPSFVAGHGRLLRAERYRPSGRG
jgi:hypothetical protein